MTISTDREKNLNRYLDLKPSSTTLIFNILPKLNIADFFEANIFSSPLPEIHHLLLEAAIMKVSFIMKKLCKLVWDCGWEIPNLEKFFFVINKINPSKRGNIFYKFIKVSLLYFKYILI